MEGGKITTHREPYEGEKIKRGPWREGAAGR